jgi:hypothetical protein
MKTKMIGITWRMFITSNENIEFIFSSLYLSIKIEIIII